MCVRQRKVTAPRRTPSPTQTPAVTFSVCLLNHSLSSPPFNFDFKHQPSSSMFTPRNFTAHAFIPSSTSRSGVFFTSPWVWRIRGKGSETEKHERRRDLERDKARAQFIHSSFSIWATEREEVWTWLCSKDWSTESYINPGRSVTVLSLHWFINSPRDLDLFSPGLVAPNCPTRGEMGSATSCPRERRLFTRTWMKLLSLQNLNLVWSKCCYI